MDTANLVRAHLVIFRGLHVLDCRFVIQDHLGFLQIFSGGSLTEFDQPLGLQ